MSEFDKIKRIFKRFVEDKNCNLLNSENEFITNNIVNFLNSKNNSFKKALQNNTNNMNIEMSKVIKGDFIVFETYNLFQYEEQANIINTSNNSLDDEIAGDFTESFEQLF
jgi:hypothetical protein